MKCIRWYSETSPYFGRVFFIYIREEGVVSMYKKVDAGKSFVSMEDEVRDLWQEKEIVEKNYKLNQDGEVFTFFDGPPTANGKPHVGHVLTRVIKDLIPRYKVMKGYKVLRKAGWDTHGLPVELEIEKKLGIDGKEGIEEYGVENFINECKESVFKYTSMWKEMSEKIGFWVDMEDPYITYKNDYIESEWWALTVHVVEQGFPPMKWLRATRMSKTAQPSPSSRWQEQRTSTSSPGQPPHGHCLPMRLWQ